MNVTGWCHVTEGTARAQGAYPDATEVETNAGIQEGEVAQVLWATLGAKLLAT